MTFEPGGRFRNGTPVPGTSVPPMPSTGPPHPEATQQTEGSRDWCQAGRWTVTPDSAKARAARSKLTDLTSR
jgi:hypothetical protein